MPSRPDPAGPQTPGASSSQAAHAPAASSSQAAHAPAAASSQAAHAPSPGQAAPARRAHPGPAARGAAPQLAQVGDGLRVLVREVHLAPVAEVQVWARVGSADEGPREAGLAHFHEHMLFKGTERRGVGEVAGEVEGAGGRINAYTSFDVTVYHATLPSDRFADGLDVLADAVQHSVFEPEEVAREVEVVLEEIRRSEDSPHHVLSDLVFRTAYDVHPYRAPILGTPESVASFSHERVDAFFRHWYGAENFLVVLTGDFEASRAVDAAAEAFAGVRRSGAVRRRPAEPARTKPAGALLRRPFERACLEVCWPTVSFSHPDAPLLDLLAFILGEGDSSRLVQHVKETERLSDRIDASSYTPLDPGLLGASADLDPEQVLPVVRSIAREVELLRHEPPSGAELEKARANFLASQFWERESVSGIARKLGSFEVVAGDFRLEERYLETIRRATRDDLLRVAREWLPPERVVAAAVVPERAALSLTGAALVEAASAGADAARRRLARPVERARHADVHSYELANGVRVHVVPRPDVPVVGMRAAMLGGLLAETPESAGLTSFLAGTWLRGTRARSAADLAREIETLAADLDGFSGRSSVGLTVDATSDRLGPVLDLFAETLLEPALRPDEIEKERDETLAALDRREDSLGARCFDLFAETHFREHPYRLPIPGTRESVAGFTRDMLVAHHARLVDPRNLVVALVGDVDPDDAAFELGRRLGTLTAPGGEPFAPPAEEPAPAERREAELRKGRSQAHLVIGFRGLRVDDPDREALEVIAQLLSGQGGRLFLELRDRQSLAYTVSAVNMEGVAPGFFATYIATAPEKLDQARRGLLEQLGAVLQEPPDEAELERARRYLIGNFAIDQQRASARASHVALDALYGLGPDADRHYPERVAAISREDVLRVARRILTLETATVAAIV